MNPECARGVAPVKDEIAFEDCIAVAATAAVSTVVSAVGVVVGKPFPISFLESAAAAAFLAFRLCGSILNGHRGE